MLVLTRKQNEKIQIGENITITVLRMKGKGVRLGIQAPNDMNVLRGELVFDLEEDALPQDAGQEDTVLESKTVSAVGSRAAKPDRQFGTSGKWSNESPLESEWNPLKSQAAHCQPSWSI